MLRKAAAAAVILIILLAACASGGGNAESSAQSGQSQAASSGEGDTNMIPEILKMDNILDAMDLVGKTCEEAGIDEKYYSADETVYVEGNLFSAEADGYLIAHRDYKTGQHPMNNLNINVDEMHFMDLSRELTLIWGPAYASGEEPYVEVNGGAVRWERFYTGSGMLVLSQGSNNSYCTLTYALSDVPKEISDPAKAPPLYVTTADNCYFAFDRERFHDFSMKIPDDPEYSVVQIDFIYSDCEFSLLTVQNCDEIPERFLKGNWIREWEEPGVQMKCGEGELFAAWADQEFGHVFILRNNARYEGTFRDCLDEIRDSLREEDRY